MTIHTEITNNTMDIVTGSGSVSAASIVTINDSLLRTPVSNNRSIEDAVYGYMQAMRALGKTKVSVNEIAKALGISYFAANEAAVKLDNKGVIPVK